MELILASTSPYRRELLQRLVPEFRCENPGVDERAFEKLGLEPPQLASRLAEEKCRAVFSRFPNAVVIGSDQLAELDGHILGKPGTVSAAVAQLLLLSGRTHRLLTGVSVMSPSGHRAFLNETRLLMRRLTDEEAARYVQRDEPLNCAGSYRIESLGISLFDSVETTDFTAIVGLPLLQLSGELRSLGLAIP